MTQRITITVPDDIYNELQEVKANVNVSGICQKAISSAIYRQRSFEKENDKFIARLRKEREEYAQEYKNVGYENGVTDAKDLSIKSFYEIQRIHDDFPPKDIFKMHASRERCDQVIKRGELPELPDGTIDNWSFLDNFDDLYFAGWLSGVLDVWSDVKDRLTTEGSGDFICRLDDEDEEEL